MEKVFEEHVLEKSYLIFDGWPASAAAADAMDLDHGPPVNHSENWRDPNTGLHINDAESENARLKKWCRGKYGLVRVNKDGPTSNTADEDDARGTEHLQRLVSEYLFWTNKGRAMEDVMDAFVLHNGGACAPVDVSRGV